MSLRGILKLREGEPEIHILVIVPVLDIREKTLNHRCGNHIGDALCHVAAISLKGHADHFRALHHGPAAVAGIDLRADLDREMLVDRRMRVELKIDSRNNAGGYRHSLATERI